MQRWALRGGAMRDESEILRIKPTCLKESEMSNGIERSIRMRRPDC